MAALQRFVGERFVVDGEMYEIVGYDVADRDVAILAMSVAPPCRRIELSLAQVLRALFDERGLPARGSATGTQAG